MGRRHCENVWRTRRRSPLPTEIIKHRLTLKAWRFSGQAVSHFKDSPTGCLFYRSPMPESPKMFSQCRLPTHSPRLFGITYANYTAKLQFLNGEEGVFIIPEKVTGTPRLPFLFKAVPNLPYTGILTICIIHTIVAGQCHSESLWNSPAPKTSGICKTLEGKKGLTT